jgi:hypothetical protein
MFTSDYFKVRKNGLSPFEMMISYLGGSAFQTIVDNPVTSYRQFVQQYTKDAKGNNIDPKVSRDIANNIFRKHPISASFSGVTPRLIGVGIKRIPKFGFFLGYSYLFSEGEASLAAATAAAIFSAPFINPVRMIEKQQRAYFKQTGKGKSVLDIIKESSKSNYKPLFRGTVPLIGHSLASAVTGLVGQPELQKWIQNKLGEKTQLSTLATGLIASSMVTPIYVIMTNPLSRLEVIMQTSTINSERIGIFDAIKELIRDSKDFGLRGTFRGQGIGIVKGIISLTTFHQGRIWMTDFFKSRNDRLGKIPEK